MGRWFVGIGAALAVGLSATAIWVDQMNDYQTDGTIVLAVLDRPVTVTRDAQGVAHIAAENRRDMLRAQGFVTAQDRLFQMELFKEIASGRLAELVGEAGLASDTRMRVLGLPINAKRMAEQLSSDARRFLSDYLDGLNAYIETRRDEHPVELAFMGRTPEPWTVEDAVVILQYLSFRHSVNMETEALALALIDAVGHERAGSLLPINVNPDRTPEALAVSMPSHFAQLTGSDGMERPRRSSAPVVPTYASDRLAPLHLGSNNWVVGPMRSASGKPIVVNDPHVDVRVLPGVWYPMSMSTPDFQAAGVGLPAVPGILVGRTDRVAYGVTNAYGDVMDLFIEIEDPSSADHYLEGPSRVKFGRREEIIRIKDDEAAGGYRQKKLIVRSTKRGPVISDHGLVNLPKRVVSLSWNAANAFGPEIGFDRLFFARSAAAVDAAVQQMDIHMFNFVFADVDGHFGRRASGKIPIRAVGEGAIPVPVTTPGPYWVSWIPKGDMPGEIDPPRGWTGTANHDTRPTGYPHVYSTYFSPSYRYRRLKSVLDSNDSATVDDQWSTMRDVANLQAARVVPKLAPLLKTTGHSQMATTLEDWDHNDDASRRAPLVYQAFYRALATSTFEDELGATLTKDMLASWYFWQERFDTWLLAGESTWFDDVRTSKRETLEDIVSIAAHAAKKTLQTYDENSVWGDVHRVRFVSPLRRSGVGSDWLGGGDYAMGGSGETLMRARYNFNAPYDVAFFASYMMVADLAETDHIVTALPGGVSARLFNDHYADQISAWHIAEQRQTPMTRAAAQSTARTRLVLSPTP